MSETERALHSSLVVSSQLFARKDTKVGMM